MTDFPFIVYPQLNLSSPLVLFLRTFNIQKPLCENYTVKYNPNGSGFWSSLVCLSNMTFFFWTHNTQNTVVTIYIESRKTKLFMKQETWVQLLVDLANLAIGNVLRRIHSVKAKNVSVTDTIFSKKIKIRICPKIK